MRPEDLKRQRAAQEVLGRLITPMIGMKWAPFELEGMNAAWVRPERSYDRNHAILYCHGGGYTSGNLGYSRPLASKLSGVTAGTPSPSSTGWPRSTPSLRRWTMR